jgi:hypothetical protein
MQKHHRSVRQVDTASVSQHPCGLSEKISAYVRGNAADIKDAVIEALDMFWRERNGSLSDNTL